MGHCQKLLRKFNLKKHPQGTEIKARSKVKPSTMLSSRHWETTLNTKPLNVVAAKPSWPLALHCQCSVLNLTLQCGLVLAKWEGKKPLNL